MKKAKRNFNEFKSVNESKKMKDYIHLVDRGMGWVTDFKVLEDFSRENPYAVFGLLILLADEEVLYNEQLIDGDEEYEREPNEQARLNVEDIIYRYKPTL